MIYIDTSVLVAYYCPEKNSDQVESILTETANPVISQLTEVELASALTRKIREKALSQEDGKAVLSVFRTHIDKKSFTYLPIQPKHFSTAMNWIAEFNLPLRTLDALHLAIAASNKTPLLTADIKFAESAKKLGIEVTYIE
ncbi:type II toxin-antitoxin system VapC family toxin [bacterium]|nr:type II toxin-antitoxin system VapC family toxin [bacterium]